MDPFPGKRGGAVVRQVVGRRCGCLRRQETGENLANQPGQMRGKNPL